MSDEIRLDTIDPALDALKRGEIVIVVDDEDRENEGDFIMAAEKVTPEAINFVAKHGRGLVCLAATPASPSGFPKTAANLSPALTTTMTIRHG